MLLEAEMKADGKRKRRGLLPVRAGPVGNEVIRKYHIEEIYGYRGRDERVYYLNPWEFTMYWEVLPVPSPNVKTDDGVAISQWTDVKFVKGSSPQPGIHYVINEEGLRGNEDIVIFPNTPRLSRQFRHEWVLRRAHRPFVPQPDSTPMPDRAKNQEERAKLYSVYLRPWTLEHEDASSAVPHITRLNVVPASHLCARTRCSDTSIVLRRRRCKAPVPFDRSFVASWRL